MKNRLISFILALVLLIALPLSAIYKYNPYTRKLDYYERAEDAVLGDLGDVTLTGLATGNILYYNGTAWVNLATGANTNVLTLAGGVPTWAATGAPAAHAASHEVGGADLVDHNLLTNYAANRHLVLPNTLAAVLTDHNLAAHTAIGIPNPANVFYVSATGGDYTTIQAALNAQNSGGETFLIGPGTYTDTISFTANDQVIKPVGHAANVIVTQADANIVDGGAYTDCIIEGIEIRLTAPTTAINAIQVGTGTLILIECRTYLATAVALAQADQPALIGFTEAGTIRLKRGNYQYYHTGNTGGAGIKAAFRANFNLAELHLHKMDVVIVTNSGTAGVTSLFVTTGTAVTEIHNCVDVTITDPNASLVVGLGYVGGGGAHNVQGNHVDVVATANTGYGLYHNGTAIVRSGFNAIHVTDTGGTSYAFYVGASATLNSHFDDLRSDDGNNIAGTFVQVSSPADGDLAMTDELDVLGVSEFSGDTHQYEDVFMTWTDAADHMAIVQSAVAGVAGEPLIEIDDDRTGETADSDAEATITIDAEGTYAFYVSKGFAKFAGNIYQIEDVFMTWGDALDNMVISQSAIAGIEDVPLIEIDDDRTGPTVDELSEATIYMDVEGVYALYIADGDFQVAGAFGYEYTTDHNLWVGYLAGDVLAVGGKYNTFIGEEAGKAITDQDNNTFVGYQAGKNTTSATNTAVGMGALFTNSTGPNSTVVGVYAANQSNVTIDAFGAYALRLTTGLYNAAFGYDAGQNLTTGQQNALFGANAGNSLGDGSFNVMIGVASGYKSTSSDNILIGSYAGYTQTAGTRNFYIGKDSGYWNVGSYNLCLGYSSGKGVDGSSDYDYNVFIGSESGLDITSGDNNTFVGYQAGKDITTGIGNVAIGYMVGEGWLDAENDLLVIDNSNTATPLIYGDFNADNIIINGDFHVTGEIESGDYVVSQTINFDDGSPVAICSVADGYIVTDVYVEITTTWDGNGTIEIGDGDDPNGFLDDGNITQGAAAYYGSDTHARGVYLDDAKQYIYAGADTVDATLVTGTSTQGIATVFVHITRLK